MKTKNKRKILRIILLVILIIAILVCYSYLAFTIYFGNKFYPGIKVNNISLQGKTKIQAKTLLNEEFKKRSNDSLQFLINDNEIAIDLSSSAPSLNIDQTLNQIFSNQQIQTAVFGQNFITTLKFDRPSSLISQISLINQSVKVKPVSAKITIANQEVIITPSLDGKELDDQKLLSQIKNYLNLQGTKPVDLPIKILKPKFSTENAQYYKTILENNLL